MKYCPQCNRQYHDGSTFCTDDGSLLREELSPPRDPNWDPRIRGPQTDAASEQPTQWLPRDPPAPGAWVPPDERAPMTGPWQPPPAPAPVRSNAKLPPTGLATASFVCGGIAVLFGMFCPMPIPGLLAVIFGLIALSQYREMPDRPGRGFAVAGIVMGAINLAIIVLLILLSGIFRGAFG